MCKIYVYETSHSKKQEWEINGTSGIGLIKIGMTSTSSDSRIRQQLQGYPCTNEPLYTLLLEVPAVTSSGISFTDKDIHSLLIQDGVYRYLETEWFGCDVGKVLEVIRILDETHLGTSNITLIYKVLKQHPQGLTDISIAELTGLPIGHVRTLLYNTCKHHDVCFNRYKKFDEVSRKVRYYYTPKLIKGYTDLNTIDVTHPYINKRHLRFMTVRNISWEDVFNILEGRTLSESTRALAELTDIGLSAAEKFILGVREGLIKSGELVMNDKRHQRVET